MTAAGPDLTCWLLDTRSLWEDGKIEDLAEEEMKLIGTEDQESVKRKFHSKDAKMTLGSALLKRFFVSKILNVPWSEVRLGRRGDPVHGKPCYLSPEGAGPTEFNVSHQAGLVALVGCTRPDTRLGVDVVCVNERNDYRVIDQDGFDSWVDIYQEIFSRGEMIDMKDNTDSFRLSDGTEVSPDQLGQDAKCCMKNQELSVQLSDSGPRVAFNSNLLLQSKLRRFYTFWCYKEAYIKMTGEALLATWIPKLEFRSVRAPKSVSGTKASYPQKWGEAVSDAQIWFEGKRLDDVRLDIQAYEGDFMISVAAKPKRAFNGHGGLAFQELKLADILAHARSSS